MPKRKYRNYDLATFIIMGVGLALFLLTPLFIRLFNLDTDILGLLIFLLGLVLLILGFVIRFIITKVRSRSQKRP